MSILECVVNILKEARRKIRILSPLLFLGQNLQVVDLLHSLELTLLLGNRILLALHLIYTQRIMCSKDLIKDTTHDKESLVKPDVVVTAVASTNTA